MMFRQQSHLHRVYHTLIAHHLNLCRLQAIQSQLQISVTQNSTLASLDLTRCASTSSTSLIPTFDQPLVPLSVIASDLITTTDPSIRSSQTASYRASNQPHFVLSHKHLSNSFDNTLSSPITTLNSISNECRNKPSILSSHNFGSSPYQLLGSCLSSECDRLLLINSPVASQFIKTTFVRPRFQSLKSTKLSSLLDSQLPSASTQLTHSLRRCTSSISRRNTTSSYHISKFNNSVLRFSGAIYRPHIRRTPSRNQTSSSSGQQQSDYSTGSRGDRPTHLHLNHICIRLTDTVPDFFKMSPDFSFYREDVELENRIINLRSRGIYQMWYHLATIMNVVRFTAAAVEMQVVSVWPSIDDGTVKLRWRVVYLPVYKIYKLRGVSRSDPQALTDKLNKVGSWYDGYSVFHVDGEGLVYKHVVDRVMPDGSRLRGETTAQRLARKLLGVAPAPKP